MDADVVIIRTGVANTASIIACFNRLGRSVRVSGDAAEIADAPAVVLPGVGTFGAAMDAISEQHLPVVISRRIAEERPVMAICAGFQLLFEASEESPGVRGLGVMSGMVRRFPRDVRVPQFGWNRVEPVSGHGILEAGYAYFANSFAVADNGEHSVREPMQRAVAVHGIPFVAALSRGALLGCQFHPELSGPWGQRLLNRWLERAGFRAAAGDARC